MSASDIEFTLLDMREFIDEALTFVEFYQSANDGKSSNTFETDHSEIERIHVMAQEQISRLVNLKNCLNKNCAELNTKLKFSTQFKTKRQVFFSHVLQRLDRLNQKLIQEETKPASLVFSYFNIIRKQATMTNDFIGYLETSRWHKEIALEIVDKLIGLGNDFLVMFTSFQKILNLETLNARPVRQEDMVDQMIKMSKIIFPLIKRYKLPIILLCLLLLSSSLTRGGNKVELYTIDVNNKNPATRKLEMDRSNLWAQKLIKLIQNNESIVPSSRAQQVDAVAYDLAERKKSSVADWSHVTRYMREFYVFVGSLSVFIVLELFLRN